MSLSQVEGHRKQRTSEQKLSHALQEALQAQKEIWKNWLEGQKFARDSRAAAWACLRLVFVTGGKLEHDHLVGIALLIPPRGDDREACLRDIFFAIVGLNRSYHGDAIDIFPGDQSPISRFLYLSSQFDDAAEASQHVR